MQQWVCTLTVAVLCLVFPGPVASWRRVPGRALDPLCATAGCRRGAECRVVQRCGYGGVCSFRPVCLAPRLSLRFSGGCKTGQPLLQWKGPRRYDVRLCYRGDPCPRGYYCSSALQDAASRCCPGSGPTGPGTGPNPPAPQPIIDPTGPSLRPRPPAPQPIIDPTGPSLRPRPPAPSPYRPPSC